MRPAPRARPRLAAVLAVLAAHAALLAWWLQGGPRAPADAPAPRVAVRLIALPPIPVPPTAAPREAARATPTARAAPARRRTAAPPARAEDATAPAPSAITAVAAPAPPASAAASEPLPALMDSEATRRALRAAAREPGLAAQAGRQGSAVQTPDERLGTQVQRSAKGDCLKGEYLGGGMGLLSLPFLAAASLRDQCRQ